MHSFMVIFDNSAGTKIPTCGQLHNDGLVRYCKLKIFSHYQFCTHQALGGILVQSFFLLLLLDWQLMLLVLLLLNHSLTSHLAHLNIILRCGTRKRPRDKITEPV